MTARVRELLGDTDGARREYMRATLRSPVIACRGIAALQANHGGLGTARMLKLLAPLARVAGPDKRSAVDHKRLSILANSGQHAAVLAATEHYQAAPASSVAIIRAMSLRVSGDLDEAIAVAQYGFARAREERHAMRLANAGFQLGQALIWAYRLDEAEEFLTGDYTLAVRLAANRWLGWQSVLLAAVATRSNTVQARTRIDDATMRFRAEGLLDGILAATQTKAVIQRAAGDLDACESTLNDISAIYDSSGTFYLRASSQARLWESFERAEIRRARRDASALVLYEDIRRAGHPVQVSLALLGTSAVQLERGGDHTAAASEALVLSTQIGARYQVERARRLLERSANALEPIVFP